MSATAVSPVLALRAALYERLAADVELATMLGGARIHDAAPRAIAGPYVVLGEADARDRSTGDRRGEAQQARLVVWSRPGGPLSALRIAARIRALLEDSDLTLEGRRLVLLRVVNEEVRRDERANVSRVILTLNAITEAV